MTRKGRAITLSVNELEKEKLEQLALLFGKTWGEKPNISKLIKAIAHEELFIAPNHDWSQERINALEQARQILIDMGKENEAIAIAKLLLERNEPNFPLKYEVQKFIDSPTAQWRKRLDQLIRRNHPFHISYQDASERIWNFTIRHAQIALHEEHQYLDCWTEETNGNQDIEALKHNWSLRLDRIPADTSITALQRSWRSQLDFVEVELHFSGNLALKYRTKKDADLENELSLDSPPTRRVVRRTTCSFWLIREVQRYGANCEIISPQEIRARFHQELLKTLKHYE